MFWVFVSVQGLSPVAASRGHFSSRGAGLSLSRPLLLQSTGSRRAGSVVVAHGLSCSVACGIFPDQGSNPCPVHWQADSQPLSHQGSRICFLYSEKSPYTEAAPREEIPPSHERLTTELKGEGDFAFVILVERQHRMGSWHCWFGRWFYQFSLASAGEKGFLLTFLYIHSFLVLILSPWWLWMVIKKKESQLWVFCFTPD